MLILMFWLQATFRKNWQLQVQFCNNHNKGLWDPGGTDVCMYACMYIRLIGLMLLTMTLLLCRPKGFQRVSCHIRATTISSFMVWMILFALDSAAGSLMCITLFPKRSVPEHTHKQPPKLSLSHTHPASIKWRDALILDAIFCSGSLMENFPGFLFWEHKDDGCTVFET